MKNFWRFSMVRIKKLKTLGSLKAKKKSFWDRLQRQKVDKKICQIGQDSITTPFFLTS